MELIENKNIYANASTFCRLVELKNFTAVAKKMFVNQSTISRRIIALENELQVQLIKRNTRKIEITSDGHNFYRLFIEHENALKNTIDHFKSVKVNSKTTLRITVPLGLANHIISPHIAKYIREHPNLTLQIFYQNREVDLVKEIFDIAILRHIPKQQTLKIRRLCSAKFNLYCSPEYIKRYGSPQVISDLSKHIIVGRINDDNTVDELAVINCPNGDQVSIENTGPIFINNIDAALKIAKSGHAIIGGTDLLYAEEISQGTLVKIMPGYTFTSTEFYLVRLSNTMNTQLDDFIEFIENCFDKYVDNDKQIEKPH